MKRLSIAVVLLVVLAACGITAWLALRETPDAPGPGESAVVDGGSAGAAPASPAEESADATTGRKRFQAPGAAAAAALTNTVRGRVVHGGTGVAGATLEAVGAPGGDYDPRRAEAKRIFGNLFSDAELDRLEERFRGVRSTMGVDAAEGQDGGGSVRIGLGVGSDDGAPTEIDLEDDTVQDAMSAGIEMFGRMLSDPTMVEKIMDLGRLEAAGFQRYEDWPRVGSARTEPDGSFVLSGLPAGKVELRVHAPGFVRTKRIVTVGGDDVRFELSRGAVLEGLVTSRGQPVTGATVRTKTRTVETDGTGRFRVDGAVTPRESVLVTARGFVAAGRSVELSQEGPGDPVTIELEPAAIVRGVVLASDGAPLAGASVRVTKGATGFNPMMFMQLAQGDNVSAPAPSTLTDANGVFEIDGIPGGSVKLAAEHRGHLPLITEDIAVTAGATRDGLELVLTRESVVTGRVTGPEGAPVAGATVKVSLDAAGGMGAMLAGMMGGTWSTALTDDGGTYRVAGLEAGERTIRVESAKHLHEEVTREIPAEAAIEQDFALRPGHTLEGLVLKPSGDPAPNARIEVRWEGGATNPMLAMTGMGSRPDAATTTDEAGRFRFEGLQAGPYSVTADADGYLDASLEDVVQDSTDAVLQLRAAASLSGVVLDVDGNPVPGSWVHRKGGRRAGGNPWMAMLAGDPRVLTDANGRFEMPTLEAGRYQLYARREGYADSETIRLEVAEGESASDVELVLRPGESLTGRVLEKGTGNGVADALVYVPAGSGPMAGFNPREIVSDEPTAPAGAVSATTDAEGYFTLDGLTPGRVTVEVRSRGHAPASLTRVEVPGPAVRVEVGQGGRVEGFVSDSVGNAVSGTQIILSGGAMGFGRQRMATTDAEGFYEMDRVVPGSYQIMKMDSSSAFGVGGMTSVVVREGETTRHDFRPDTTGGRITGSVVRDGVPVEGAMLILTGGGTGMQMTTSEADGSFAFEGLEPGSYTVSVQASIMGGGTTSETVKVEERQEVGGVRLALSSLVIEGRVLDAATGNGIPLAQVILFDHTAGRAPLTSLEEIMRHQRGQSITDDKGRFRIEGVSAGTFALRVSAAGYSEETREGVKAGASLTLRLDPGTPFEVTVVGPGGEPVQGATVVARDAQGRETMAFGMGGLEAVTNGQGLATLRLSSGRYTIVAESAGMPAATADVDAARGSVVIRLEDGGTLEVVVRQNGEAAPGARVALQDEQGRPIAKRVSIGNIMGGGAQTTDAAGRLVREGLPPGTVRVIVTPPDGGTPVTRSVSIRRGGTERLEVDLP